MGIHSSLARALQALHHLAVDLQSKHPYRVAHGYLHRTHDVPRQKAYKQAKRSQMRLEVPLQPLDIPRLKHGPRDLAKLAYDQGSVAPIAERLGVLPRVGVKVPNQPLAGVQLVPDGVHGGRCAVGGVHRVTRRGYRRLEGAEGVDEELAVLGCVTALDEVVYGTRNQCPDLFVFSELVWA